MRGLAPKARDQTCARSSASAGEKAAMRAAVVSRSLPTPNQRPSGKAVAKQSARHEVEPVRFQFIAYFRWKAEPAKRLRFMRRNRGGSRAASPRRSGPRRRHAAALEDRDLPALQRQMRGAARLLWPAPTMMASNSLTPRPNSFMLKDICRCICFRLVAILRAETSLRAHRHRGNRDHGHAKTSRRSSPASFFPATSRSSTCRRRSAGHAADQAAAGNRQRHAEDRGPHHLQLRQERPVLGLELAEARRAFGHAFRRAASTGSPARTIRTARPTRSRCRISSPRSTSSTARRKPPPIRISC